MWERSCHLLASVVALAGCSTEGPPSTAASPDAGTTDVRTTDANTSSESSGSVGESGADASSDGIYVAPLGTSAACALADPCSLSTGIAAARANIANASADLVVILRGGTYRLAQSVALDISDSGQNGHRVVYRAYPGETPILSGGVALTGFTSFNASNNVWSAPVPASLGTAPLRQMFVNGVRAQRARSAGSPAGLVATATGFTTTDGVYATFKNASTMEVAMDNDWKHMRCPLANVAATTSGGSALTVLPSCWNSNNLNVPTPNFPWNGIAYPPLSLTGISWVENAYELLDTPGEFYFDPLARHIYYIPRPGEDLSAADVEVPALEELLTLSGTPGHLSPLNDDDPAATYTGSWQYLPGRTYGDFNDDVHATTAIGDAVSFAFTGTGAQVIAECDPQYGSFQASVDGVLDSAHAYTENATDRVAQQVVYSVSNLPLGPHTVEIASTAMNGAYVTIDAFVPISTAVAPVHDIAFEGLTFEYATWDLPSTVGYIDNQAGVLWDTSGTVPTAVRIQAAVQVHRGTNVSFTGDTFQHLGGTAIDLADGTQGSTVVGCTVQDVSGGGISVGEVDDYFQSDPSLVTSGDTISDDVISFVGMDYHDAVGVWAGYTQNLVVAHNDIGHTPYSGISLGWGWGWASSCTLQANQGTVPYCRHGTNYAGGNQIVFNYVHDVMGHLFDGGPIYTLGGQGEGSGSLTSVLASNFVTAGNDTNNMLYQDEGSSYWDTHDNVTSLGGANWIGMWTPTIHDITVGPVNYTDNPNTLNNGTNVAYTAPTLVTLGNWPQAALGDMSAAGLESAYVVPATMIDDDSQSLAYAGTWAAQGFRGFGDYEDNVHYTTNDGDSVTLTFTGTGVSSVGEKDPSQGAVAWSIDGQAQGTVDTSLPAGTAREVQQVLYTSATLAAGSHVLQITKSGGTYMTVDAFRIQP